MSPQSAHGDNHKIGLLLLESGVITPEQLTAALKRQSECGERIGSVLLQLGYLNTETLLEFLHRHFGRPVIDLYHVQIDLAVLNILSYEQMKQFQVLPLSLSSKGVFVAMADPDDIKTVDELRLITGRIIEPVVVPHSQMSAALRYIEQHGGRLSGPLCGREIEAEQNEEAVQIPDTGEFASLIRQLFEQKASALLLSAGVPPSLKLNHEIVRLPGPGLTPSEVEKIARELMTDLQWQRYTAKGELYFSRAIPESGRIRISAYRQQGTASLAIRPISERIPTPSELGLPDWIEKYALHSRGLILITGPAGHGRSTTLAALVNAINTNRKCNIISVEDPVEFLHRHMMSNVNQREVGRDTPTVPEGLCHVLRQSPDVIVIDDLRDPDSFAGAVQAADAGHLVIGTMYADTTTAAIERIIEVFPPEQQHRIRMQLAGVLLLVLNQRLIHHRNGSVMVLACETLTNSVRIGNMIREGRTGQIRSLLQAAAEEYLPIDASLSSLVLRGDISLESGLMYCENPATFRQLVSGPVAAGG
jgi:twitching motility protein PilT